MEATGLLIIYVASSDFRIASNKVGLHLMIDIFETVLRKLIEAAFIVRRNLLSI